MEMEPRTGPAGRWACGPYALARSVIDDQHLFRERYSIINPYVPVDTLNMDPVSSFLSNVECSPVISSLLKDIWFLREL